MTVVDQLGRTVTVPDHPKRIVSLVPSQTELLYNLGLDKEVAGITKFCVHPEAWFRSKTRIGGTKSLNIELIKNLNPDLIIGNKEENEQSQVELLAKDFPVWMSDIHNLNEALDMIDLLGKITGKSNEAKALIEKIKFSFDQLSVSGLQQFPSALYMIWHHPWMAAGGDTFIHDMMTRCGFQNMFSNKMRYPELEPEQLAGLKPDYIILSSEPFPFRQKHAEELKMLSPHSKILFADGEMFSWYGSRMLQAVPYFRDFLTKIHSGF